MQVCAFPVISIHSISTPLVSYPPPEAEISCFPEEATPSRGHGNSNRLESKTIPVVPQGARISGSGSPPRDESADIAGRAFWLEFVASASDRRVAKKSALHRKYWSSCSPSTDRIAQENKVASFPIELCWQNRLLQPSRPLTKET